MFLIFFKSKIAMLTYYIGKELDLTVVAYDYV